MHGGIFGYTVIISKNRHALPVKVNVKRIRQNCISLLLRQIRFIFMRNHTVISRQKEGLHIFVRPYALYHFNQTVDSDIRKNHRLFSVKGERLRYGNNHLSCRKIRVRFGINQSARSHRVRPPASCGRV